MHGLCPSNMELTCLEVLDRLVVLHGNIGLLILRAWGVAVACTLLVVIRVTAILCGSICQPSGMFVFHGLLIGTVVRTDCYQSVIVDYVFILHACTLSFYHGLHGCLFDLSSWCELRCYFFFFVQSCSCGLPCGFLPLAGSNAYAWTYIELFLVPPHAHRLDLSCM